MLIKYDIADTAMFISGSNSSQPAGNGSCRRKRHYGKQYPHAPS